MTDQSEILGRIIHSVGKMQERVLHTANTSSKANLQWGQFVVEPRPGAQVGVYGSSCAAIILRLHGRDDDESRGARSALTSYVTSGGEAETELAHNIKLAMVVLALAPSPGQDADQLMLTLLGKLLDRCSQSSSLWPAYSCPAALAGVTFSERDSEVATAVILILLEDVLRRLTSQRYVSERGRIDQIVKQSALTLERAYVSKRSALERFSTLIGTAVILIRGRDASAKIRKTFGEAVRTCDFADRRVFFYECLRVDGTLTRDYFIVPPAVILPLIAGRVDARATDRALALSVVPDLLEQLDDEGLFKGGQAMPSTVEQALVGLAMQAVERGKPYVGVAHQFAASWIYVTRPNAKGVPTKLIGTIVVMLWVVTGLAIAGKAMPTSLRTMPILQSAYSFASAFPEALSQLLVFLTAVWPASRSLFLRIFRRNG
jgi:hypothetical protein